MSQTQTRARGGAPVTTGGVRIPPGERRTPIVIVDVTVGEVTLAYTVSGLRRGIVLAREPIAPDGSPAVRLPPGLEDRVYAAIFAAVAADTVAPAHLRQRGTVRRLCPAPPEKGSAEDPQKCIQATKTR
jgi:hypothetical protein